MLIFLNALGVQESSIVGPEREVDSLMLQVQ